MAEAPLVLLDALLVTDQPTGVGRAILELTRALAADRRGLRFAVLATHREQFAFLDGVPDWQVVDCPGARGGAARKALYTQTALPSLAKRLGAALIHSLQFVAPLAAAPPRVVTVHDLSYRLFPETVEPLRRRYYRVVVPASLRRAAAIVANSRATAADIATAFPFTRGRVAVTPFGTPSWVWDHDAAPPAGPDAPYLFVGTLEPRKNLPRLLVAYRGLLAREERLGAGRFPDLVLVGGRGWLDSPLRRPLEELRARGRLRLEGYCGPDRLWEWYATARALLFPSLYEGFGFPILEAMAAGLPVLTADRGAMREVAADAALRVDPLDVSALTDALARIHLDEQLRHQLRVSGRERARLWSWERTAAATVAVYRRTIAAAGAGGGEIHVAAP